MTYAVKQGDVLEVTREYPDNHFDGLFCDPPYGLSFMGKDWDKLGDVGRDRRKAIQKSAKGSIMGAKNETPRIVRSRRRKCLKCGGYSGGPFKNCECENPDWERDSYPQGMQDWYYIHFKEALRVLKPGAWGLVFGGTRTWHRLACALEDAGFELRDTLMWLYGSGFPKSFDISKGIDKHGGQAVGWFGEWLRKWRTENNITQKQIAELFPSKTGGLTGCVANWELGFNMPTCEQFNKICKAFNLPFDSLEEAEREVVGKYKSDMGGLGGQRLGQPNGDITIPATPEAKRWQGYGTALKPSWEPVLLIRKPLDGNNVQNALKHGCGGLNIDGGRIATDKPIEVGRAGRKTQPMYSPKPTESKKYQAQGRFPANLILDEASAAMLDAQSGELTSGGGRKGNVKNGVGMFGSGKAFDTENVEPSTGGASRFFYCAKVSPAERNVGFEGFEEKDKRPLGISQWEGQTNGSGKTMGASKPQRNHHPTVKPLDLCRYLATLILPPERTQKGNDRTQIGNTRKLLVPFAGSGSEMIGALQADWDEVDGIEIDPDYCKIAEARLHYWCKREREKIPF